MKRDPLPQHLIEARTARIEFNYYPDRLRRVWTAIINLPDGEYHAGEGTTQCEALLLANVHWATHGQNK